jgi:hypothetical protein
LTVNKLIEKNGQSIAIADSQELGNLAVGATNQCN